MKTTIKTLMLTISIIAAIAAIMVYAKTQVKPPVSLKQTNQYISDLNSSIASFSQVEGQRYEDSIFLVTLDRIAVFTQQNKLNITEADTNKDRLLEHYVPLFLQHSFDKFRTANWIDSVHNYMLKQIAIIKAVKHNDNSIVASKAAIDSLSMVEGIITRYRKARLLAMHTGFNGVENARNVISQVGQLAKDVWLAHCTSLVVSLNGVRGKIADSHYNYVLGQVQRMGQYRYLGQDYYDNTLVPHVDAVITEYEKNAMALYGTRRNVDTLWERAKSYYNDAAYYYRK